MDVCGGVLLALFAPGLAGGALPADAEPVDAFVGRTVVEVTVRREGDAVPQASVADLIETRVGAPLSMRQVRESLVHLFSLGEYADVLVEGRLLGDGVALTYRLVQRALVERIEFDSGATVADDELRAAVVAVHGPVLDVDAVPSVAGTVRAVYRDHGYLNARVTTELSGPERSRQLLRIQVQAGDRAAIAQIFLTGVSFSERASTLARLGIGRGQPYDRPDIERRLLDYESELVERRYYEADLGHAVERTADGSGVNLRIHVRRGPRVTVTFAGDDVPGENLHALAAVEREGTVDEDLLEDAGRRIARRLHDRGYRDAVVEHVREADGEELSIVFHVERGSLYELAAVGFSGNGRVPDAALADLITLAPGTPLITRELDTVLASLTEHYLQLGFATARVVPVITPVDAAATANAAGVVRVNCDFEITEGAQTRIRSLAVDDPQGRLAATAPALPTQAPGDPYYLPRVIADGEAIRGRLLEAGFENAVVTTDSRFDDPLEAVDIVYRVNAGTQVFIEHVLVVGNRKIAADTIRREITLVEGNPLNLADVAETRRRLNALGLFRRIDIREFSHGVRGRRDVVVIVDEAPATRMAYGGGLEASVRLRREAGATGNQAVERLEFAPRGFVQIGRGNLGGKNRSIDLFVRASLRRKNAPPFRTPLPPRRLGVNEYRVLGTYQEPRVLDTDWDGYVTGFVERAIRPGFDLFSRGVTAQLVRQLGSSLTASVDYGWGQNDTSNKELNPQDVPLVDRLFPQVRLSAVSGRFVHDTRDDEIDPHRGALITVDGRLAARAIGSEVGLAKLFAGAFVYREIPRLPRFVAAAGVRVGLARPFVRSVYVTPQLPPDFESVGTPGSPPPIELQIEDLPLSERFFAGGDTSVRGFALDRLGDAATIDRDGFPQGGSAMVVFNGELRYTLTRTLDLVGFLDGGNVYDKISHVSLARIRGGAGFGVRYRSPVGPIRVDLGFKLDRQTFDNGEVEKPTALHISIGQAF